MKLTPDYPLYATGFWRVTRDGEEVRWVKEVDTTTGVATLYDCDDGGNCERGPDGQPKTKLLTGVKLEIDESKLPEGMTSAYAWQDLLNWNVVRQARTYLNCPFVYGGRDRTGIDCIGLVIAIGRDLGYVEPDFNIPPYPQPPNPDLFDEIFPQHLDEVPRDWMSPGDVVVLRARLGGKRGRSGEQGVPRHVGIVGKYEADPNADLFSLIYVEESMAVAKVTESRFDGERMGRVYKCYRWRYES